MDGLFASTPTLKLPQISSIGPPPEKHADRVVAAMMRHLVERSAHLRSTLADVLKEGYRAGSARAQTKLAQRIKRAGAVDVHLIPGKRGQYRLMFDDISGWDPHQDGPIGPSDPIPPKPWLVFHVSEIRNPGNNLRPKFFTHPAVFITHHVLSRAAQRLDLRTTGDAQTLTKFIAHAAMVLMANEVEFDPEKAPPNGHRIQLELKTGGTITLVCKKHTTRAALVAATIF